MTKELNEMKQLAGMRIPINETAESTARKLMNLAMKQKIDENANMLSRVGESLLDYGQPFGPTNLKQVAERAGVTEQVVLKALEYAKKN